jgi:hypothetical protein
MTETLPLDTFARTTSRDPASDSAKPYRGRRLSWAEFFRERPDLRPDNDNDAKVEAAGV